MKIQNVVELLTRKLKSQRKMAYRTKTVGHKLVWVCVSSYSSVQWFSTPIFSHTMLSSSPIIISFQFYIYDGLGKSQNL